MSCSPFDLNDYQFGELAGPDRRAVQDHLAHCDACSAELDRLRNAILTLRSIPDEEMPRRIAFVSDKVFAPSPWVRWWQALWASSARLAAASAFALAAAIAFHAVHQSAPVTVVQPPAAAQRQIGEAEVNARINAVVEKAVAQTETRYEARLNQVIARNAAERRTEMQRVAEYLDAVDRHNRVITVAQNRLLETGQ